MLTSLLLTLLPYNFSNSFCFYLLMCVQIAERVPNTVDPYQTTQKRATDLVSILSPGTWGKYSTHVQRVL